MRCSIPRIENPADRVSTIQAQVHGRQILGQRLKTTPAGSAYRDSVGRTMFGLISRNHCARCLAGVYFPALLHGGSNGLLRICNRMVRRMVGEPKASEPIVDILRPEIRLGHPQAAPDPLSVGGTLPVKSIMIAWNDCVSHFFVSD